MSNYDEKAFKLKERVCKMAQARYEGKQEVARRVRFTLDDELTLEAAGPAFWGNNLCARIVLNGLRSTLTTFLGLAVSWDAEQLVVE